MELEIEISSAGELIFRIIAAGTKINKLNKTLALKQLELVKDEIMSDFDGDIKIIELDEEDHIHAPDGTKIFLKGKNSLKK